MFTTPCFIRKNTPELREKLEKLGYKICPCALFYDACWLDTNVDTVHGIGYSDETYPLPQEEQLKRFLKENEIEKTPLIDCGTNEELFLALAALSDDTDKDQWFTDGTDWAIWREDGSFRGKLIAGFEFHYLPSNTNYNKYHKATAKEIIEHFTMEGGAE